MTSVTVSGILLVILLAGLFLGVNTEVKEQGEVEINEPTYWENATVWIENRLVVNSILGLNNVSLIMKSMSDDKEGCLMIDVYGELNINGSTIRAANPGYGYRINYWPGSRGNIRNSTIEDIGTYSSNQLNPGLLIEGSGIVIEGNRFYHSRGTCISGWASHLRIMNNIFEETMQGGVQIGGPGVICTNVSVASNTFIKIGKLSHPSVCDPLNPDTCDICHAGSDDGIGIDYQGSEGRIFGNFLTEGRCSAIEIERGSTVGVYYNTITDNLDWGMNIHDPETRVCAYGNVIENIILRGSEWVYNFADLETGPPIEAMFNYFPETPLANQELVLNASLSYSWGGNITCFQWDLEGGKVINTTQPIMNHTYHKEGKYTVTLTVVDNYGFYDGAMANITVTFIADLNKDLTVDIYDAIVLANAYNSKPGNPNWNSNADINSDKIVDIYDAIILANNYGKAA